jgi:hypothetical protein
MSSKIILPEGVVIPDENANDTQKPIVESSDFPFRVKYVAPVEIKLLDFVSKEGNVQGPRKLVAFFPTGEAFVIVPDAQALTPLTQDEIQSANEWNKALHEKARLLGGNIVIDPATGEVKAGPMPGMLAGSSPIRS